MANYQEARVKVANTQLNKLKSSAKDKTRTILRLIEEKLEDESMPYDLYYQNDKTIRRYRCTN